MKSQMSTRKLEKKCVVVAALLKALAHPGRLLVMGHLANGEKTVSELQQLCDLSQSQLSQFLNRMKLEGLVQCEKRGRFQYYSTADKRVAELIRSIQLLFC